MSQPVVAVVGAGFGGLEAVKTLSKFDIRIKLIDKNNYHTFYPLLYQVSAAELTSEQIAIPIRSILRKKKNVEFIMGEVIDIDKDKNKVILRNFEEISYDYLVIATGTQPFYFGIEGAEDHTYTIDSLVNGEKLRNKVLKQFEIADRLEDKSEKEKVLKFVIIGAGPTGVEYATALSELIHGPLKKDFSRLDLDEVSIILIEAMEKVLPMLDSDKLSDTTLKELNKRNIDVKLNAKVKKVDNNTIYLSDDREINAETKIWTAGVQGAPDIQDWDLPVEKRNLLPVDKFLRVKGHKNIFAIGDISHFKEAEGPLPKLAPVAMQMGKHVAKNIMYQIREKELKPFEYKNQGELIVLGRFDAVARLWGREFSGFFAWLLWGFVHIFNLIGFRNRLFVIINWLWDLLRFEKVERLIIEDEKSPDNKKIHEELSLSSKA